jgi:tetratricopeptide (TPR) repeat protein
MSTQGQWARAVELLEEIGKDFDKDLLLEMELARALRSIGRHREAIESYKQALDLAESYRVRALEHGNPRRQRASTPELEFTRFSNAVMELVCGSKPTDACPEWEEIVQQTRPGESDRVFSHVVLPQLKNDLAYTLADAHLDEGRAQDLVKEALAAAPTDPGFLDTAGYVKLSFAKSPTGLQIDKVREAERYFREALFHLGADEDSDKHGLSRILFENRREPIQVHLERTQRLLEVVGQRRSEE